MHFLKVPDLLTPDEVARLRDLAKRVRFVDGRSASNPGSQVKNNLQPEATDPAYLEAGKLVQQAFFRNALVRAYAYPKRIAMPMLTKYEPGMEYGLHTDACTLATQPPIRADVSCTVFLNDPADYAGGELSTRLGDAEVDVKLPPGHAVFYPSVTLHQVKPVTRGERLVAIAFLESTVRDHYQRQLLFTLTSALGRVDDKLDWESRTQLSHVLQNLQRMWSES
jgi:PKHD-type hydroxylase